MMTEQEEEEENGWEEEDLGDGWDEEDDDLFEKEEEALAVHPVAAGTNSTSAAAPDEHIPMGSGLLMGRLSRFIEAVTQPEDSDGVERALPTPPQPAQHRGWRQQLQQPLQPAAAAPTRIPPSQGQYPPPPVAPILPQLQQLQQPLTQPQILLPPTGGYEPLNLSYEPPLDDDVVEPSPVPPYETSPPPTPRSANISVQPDQERPPSIMSGVLKLPRIISNSLNDITAAAAESEDSDIQEEHSDSILEVDHVPSQEQAVLQPSLSESVQSLVDESLFQQEEQAMDNPAEFGPVVDHLPPEEEPEGNPFSLRHSISLAVQPGDVIPDDEDDEDDLIPTEGWDEEEVDLDFDEPEEEEVVDHLPSDATPRTFNSTSVQSIPDSSVQCPSSQQENSKDVDDDPTDFGPVVDHLPTNSLPVFRQSESMAVQAGTGVLEDNENDDLEDGEGWAEEEVDFEDGEGWAEEAVDLDCHDETDAPVVQVRQPPQEEEVVDHIPTDATPSHTVQSVSVQSIPDASLAVSSQQPDETAKDVDNDPNDFGPVVDHLPPEDGPRVSFKSSESMAVQADDALEDDDDLEEANGWDEDGLDNLEESLVKVEAPAVDHVPTDATPSHTVQSASVQSIPDASLAVSSQQPDEIAKDVDNDPNDFGPVVDHLPTEDGPRVSFKSSESMAVQADDAAKDDDDLEEANGWDEDGLDDIEESPMDQPVYKQEENLAVDHVPDKNSVRRLESVSTQSIQGDEMEDNLAADDDPDKADYGPMVDVLPKTEERRGYGTDSLAAQMGDVQDDDNFLSEDVDDANNGWDEEDGLDAIGDAVVACEELPESTPPAVDHVPLDRMRSLQSVSTESVLGDQSTEPLENDDDPDNELFGRVVDHLPSQHSSRRRDESTGVQVSGGSDNLTSELSGDANSKLVTKEIIKGGNTLVDHIPDAKSSSTPGDSTALAMASQISATPDDAWDNDFEPRSELDYLPVVDHTPPTPLTVRSSTQASPSMAVQAPIEEMEGESGSDEEEENFGPIVDVLPSLPQRTSASIGESMAVQAAPSEIDDEEDMDDRVPPLPEVDEHNEELGRRDDDSSEAPPMHVGSDAKEEPLVDHVPGRNGPRPTDASTMVVIDPSEVSTVGDMTCEEQQYGPVVSHIPEESRVTQPSAAGSTMADASTKLDDLDDTVEGGVRNREGEDESVGDGTIPTVEGAVPAEANVVDHVPENESLRDMHSDTTLSIGQSLVSRDETRDGDFGPIVDHTPLPVPSRPPSRGSMAVLAPPSEIDSDDDSNGTQEAGTEKAALPGEKVATLPGEKVVDLLPPPREVRPEDSIAAVKSTGSEDGTIEEGRFGPVIDGLPFLSSSSSLPLSFGGGSTTGALATLSEVDDDEEEWDDDDPTADLLSGVQTPDKPTPEKEFPTTEERRGLSVTFSSPVRVNETRYYDPEPASESLYYDPLQNESDLFVDVESGRETVSCRSCANAKTAECPCIQSILPKADATNGSAMVATVTTPQGVPVRIDFNKLLQHEITKRLLLERELEACQASIRSLEEGSSSRLEIDRLHMNLVEELESEQKESASLRVKNKELVSMLAEAQRDATEAKTEKDNLISKEVELNAEIKKVRAEFESSRCKASAEWETRQTELLSAVQKLEAEKSQVETHVEKYAVECAALKEENTQQKSDLAAAQAVVSELDKHKTDWTTRKFALEEEISQLRVLVEKASSASSSEAAVQVRISSLEKDLASKSEESTELRAQLAQLSQRLKQSEGQNFAHMKESSRLTKHHEQEKAKLLASSKKIQDQLDNMIATRDHADNQRNEQLKARDAELAELKRECLEMEKNCEDTRKASDRKAQEHKLLLQQKQSELRALDLRMKALEIEKTKLEDQLSQKATLLQKSEQAMAKKSEERQSMEVTLRANEETIQKLQERVDSLTVSTTERVDDSETLLALSQECNELRSSLGRCEKEIESVRSRLDITIEEKETLRTELEETERKCHELEASVGAMKLNALKLESKMKHSQEGLQSVQADLSSAYDRVVKERAGLMLKHNELKSRYEETLAKEKSKSESLKQTELALRNAQEESRGTRREMTDISVARDEWLLKCQNFESQVSQIQKESSRNVELQEQISSLQQERDALSNELDEVKNVSNQYHSKCAKLERELAGAKNALAAKEGERNGFHTKTHDTDVRDEALVSKCNKLEAQLSELREQNSDLAAAARQLAEKEDQLNSDLDLLISEREANLQERDDLEEENEEVLVQLGLAKQQLDAHEAEIKSLQSLIDDKDASVMELQRRLDDTTSRLDVKALNGSHDSAEIASLKQRVNDLIANKADLQKRLDKAEAEKLELSVQLESLARQESELQEVETKYRTLSATAESKEQGYVAEIRALEERCSDLNAMSERQQQQVSRLTAQLQEGAALSVSHAEDEILSLQEQITHLEQACAERDEAIDEKDAALENLQRQVNALRGEANTLHQRSGNIVSDLSRSLQQTEQTASQYLSSLQTAQAELEATRQELKQTSEKLSKTETALLDMELDMDIRDQGASEHADTEGRLRDMEARLQEKSRQTDQLLGHKNELESKLATLQLDLDMARTTSLAATNQETGRLRAELKSLQEENRSCTSTQEKQREALVQEVASLGKTISQKDSHIAHLEQQLQSLSVELSSSQNQLVSKETEYRRLSMELEELRAQQLRSTQQATSQVLDSASSPEEAESTDNLRTHIISLAVSLEKSEHQRADAMGKLLKERKAHADSLRRLGESVKRFYSALSCGET